MKKPGILRFDIQSEIKGPGRWRFMESQKRWPMANELYRSVFSSLGLTLLGGCDTITCTKEEAKSNYDIELGIDVLFNLDNGLQITCQEKFLFTSFYTVTVEYFNDPANNIPGDWFTLRSNWYFVGYDTNKTMEWNKWILLDWPAVKLATSQGLIAWQLRQNQSDNAKANFKYARFDNFPANVVVAQGPQQIKQLGLF